MAAKPLSAFLFCFLFAIIRLAFSRELQPTTAVLDVAASLRRARQVLSSSSSQNYTSPSPPPHTSSFYLHVHPRESLLKPYSSYRDYRSLVLSRLARDAVRVDYLNNKLQLALGNLIHKEVGSKQFQVEGLSAPLISGLSQGSGEYFTRVGIGSPARGFYMTVDTGSDVSWLQCRPCAKRYKQTDPIFDPTSSTTYRPVSCNSQQCRAGLSKWEPVPLPGPVRRWIFTKGDLATETVSFGGSGAVNGIALGCGRDNEGFFVGSAGLLGLGGGSLSLTGQIKARSFSYCLVHRDSSDSSTLDFDSGAGAGSVTAPLIRNGKLDTFYYVGLAGISVNGNPLPIPPSVFQIDGSGRGGIIVDSGTTITQLQTDAYNILRDAFVQQAQGLLRTSGTSQFDTCYDFSSRTRMRVPTVSFQFPSGGSWTLPAENYLIPIDSAGTFCFAFRPTSGPLSILGNVQQQGTRVSFDLANSLVGFSPNRC